MARRRGLGDAERFALDVVTVTATGAVVAAPCFVYSLEWTVTDSSVSALFSVGDTTAAADLAADGVRWETRMGMTVASGATDVHNDVNFMPPLFIAKQLFWANSTGIDTVSVSYVAAS